MMPARQLTAAILAGGASRRMGGQDKGLVPFHDRPLIAWVIEALEPQVDEILIVANRNLEAYRSFGHRVVSDLRPDYPGPLAGIETALTHATHDSLLVCPTDAPLLPACYAQMMGNTGSATAAVAVIDSRWQPVFSLVTRSALPGLSARLDRGERKAQSWLASLTPALVNLDAYAEQLQDVDTQEALQALIERAR